MSSGSPIRSRARTLLLWAAPLTWLGCGGGGTDIVLPALSVTTSTQGVELDPDGYNLVIDGSQTQSVGLAATLVVERLPDGEHTLELTGLAANCSTQGENPRTVTVRSGATTTTDFAVTCGATSGSVEIAASTSGTGTDPDGFAIILDGVDRGPLAISGTVSLSGVSPGVHSVGLTGLAGNCQVAGENPREVTVVASQTAQVPFSVTCLAPAPSSGAIDITTTTTGSNQDADGYGISLDGGASQPIGLNARLTLPNLSSSTHRVELLGVALNCAVSGANPRNVTITTGQTTTVGFAVTCSPPPAETGSVRVTASTTGGSPDQDGYGVRVDGGASQGLNPNGSHTIQGLPVGAHSIDLDGVAANCSVTGQNPQNVTVVSGQTVTVAFSVGCVATGPTVNLRVERMYLTQSTQRVAGNVPLVPGRDGLLRVFATASGANNLRPNVRVRLYRNGVVVQTFTIPASRSSTPTSVDQDPLGSSWNVEVPGSLITTNLGVLAEVDPENAVPESDESDNSLPASGAPQALTVIAAPPAAIRFVPIRQTANGLEGTVANPDQLIDLARRMYPLDGVTTDVGPALTVSGPLQALNENGQWNQILSDLEARRVADGATDRTYYGLVRLDYGSGIVGNGFVGAPSAIGTDNPADVRRVIAHELGHTWNQLHTPCGGPPSEGVDRNFPYRSGSIGVYGYDRSNGTLKLPSLPDIMGYCENPWISDYIYERVQDYRRSNPLGIMGGAPQPTLLLWGHIVAGQAILEPAFQIVTRPHLPKAPGPYSLEVRAADATQLFSLSFDAVRTADDPSGSRHFAFAVPLDQARAARLGSVRLSGPGLQAVGMSQAAGRITQGAVTDDIVLQREGGDVALKWNASAHPMIMVRDPRTGEVLSFARGGNARIWTEKAEVDLEISDGVRSQRERRAISR